MARKLVHAALLLAVVLVVMTAQHLPTPKRLVGFAFNEVSRDAPIHLDIHMGPLCPDSAEAFPNAKAVAMHYGSRLRWTTHIFPRPYYHQEYLTAIGGHVIDHATSKKLTYSWFEDVFAGLDQLSNEATTNMTQPEVISLLASFARKCCNVSTSAFESQMAIKEFDSATRIAWKYSCSRSVSFAPTYFLNDVPIEAEQTWTLDDWKKVIDPLLVSTDRQPDKDCPSRKTKCTYFPGKAECCTKREACIPYVGCRRKRKHWKTWHQKKIALFPQS